LIPTSATIAGSSCDESSTLASRACGHTAAAAAQLTATPANAVLIRRRFIQKEPGFVLALR
jgi:hypothetical protein